MWQQRPKYIGWKDGCGVVTVLMFLSPSFFCLSPIALTSSKTIATWVIFHYSHFFLLFSVLAERKETWSGFWWEIYCVFINPRLTRETISDTIIIKKGTLSLLVRHYIVSIFSRFRIVFQSVCIWNCEVSRVERKMNNHCLAWIKVITQIVRRIFFSGTSNFTEYS